VGSGALQQVLNSLGGGERVGAFFLVLARIAPLFVLAPLFSSKMVPRRVRAVIAVAIAVGLAGVAARGQHVPGDPLGLLGAMIEQVVIGLGFAFTVGVVMAAVEVAGSFTDTMAGFSFGSLVDPINGNQGGVVTQFYSIVGILVFIAIGGDAWVLRGLARTFDLIPLTAPIRLNGLVAGAEQAFASIFVSALEVAAPALLALVITDVAFGMVSRVMPQLNVFAVGFPMKVGVSLLIMGATLALLGNWMTGQLESSVGTALHALRVA
jgi:flagellar biosynthetic protein FliR